MPTQLPSLNDLKNARLASVDRRLQNNKEPDRFARAVLAEKKMLEMPDAIVDPNSNEIRSVSEFYADGKANQESNASESKEVQFTKLFQRYGTPEYVAKIVDELSKQLSKEDQQLIIQNASFLHKQIKDNLGANTSVDYFIDFVKNLIEKRSEKLGETSRNNSSRKELTAMLKVAKDEGHVMVYDGVEIKFVKPVGVRNLAAGLGARSKRMNLKIQEIKDRNRTDGDTIVQSIVRNYVTIGGTGLTSRLTKRTKKYIHRPINLKVIRGGGMVTLNPIEKASHKIFTKDATFLELNKYIIDADKLKNDNQCDIRYALNGKRLKTFKCNDAIKDMIVDLTDNTFSLSKYGKLNQQDKKFILKFAEQAHIDVGMTDSIEDANIQYKVYEGELEAGNPAPMVKYLFDSFSRGRLPKQDYLNALNEIYKK